MIAYLLRKLAERDARKRLEQIVQQTLASPGHQQYLKRRAAAKLGHARRKGVVNG